MAELIINPGFRDIIRPLKPEEFSMLEDNILKDKRVLFPLVVWNGTIVDGHNRWTIIQKHPEIPYTVQEVDFPDEWAAKAWICANQLGRRNLTDEERTYTIGKQCEAQKMSLGAPIGNNNAKKQCRQNDGIEKGRTTERIARQHGIAPKSVERAEKFAKGVDTAETIQPGVKETILSGTTKVPKKVIAELPKMEPEQQKEVIQRVTSGKPWDKPKAQPPLPKGTKQTIAEVAAFLYDTDRVIEHTADDLVESLTAETEDFVDKIKRSLEIYSTVLNENGAKEKVTAVLSEAETAIQKIREAIS